MTRLAAEEVVLLVPTSLDAVALREILRRSTDRLVRVVSLGDCGTVEMVARVETVGRAYKLSPREREVLLAIVRGASNEDIADELGIALSTVKRHVENVLRGTGSASRIELLGLVAFGIRRTH